MQTINDLKAETTIFFNRHWGFPTTPPEWQTWGNFLATSVPNYDKGGCYALFEDETLVYIGIGIGISSSDERYRDHGISRRMMYHVYCSDRPNGKDQLKLREKWVGHNITSCATIGFDADKTYLAAALEVFLIRKLQPIRNQQLKKF